MLEYNQSNDGFQVYVTEEDGNIVGFTVFKLGTACYIDNILIAKVKQGRGLGKAFLSYTEKLFSLWALEYIDRYN